MTTFEPTTTGRPRTRDGFSEAMEAAFSAGPTFEEREAIREARAARRRARREALSRFFTHPLVYTWGDRALWVVCLIVVVFSVVVPAVESL